MKKLITSYTFERPPETSEVNLDRRHRGNGGLTGPTGHLDHYTVRSGGYNLASDGHDGITQGGIVVEGSLFLYLHKVTSFFVFLFAFVGIVSDIIDNDFE